MVITFYNYKGDKPSHASGLFRCSWGLESYEAEKVEYYGSTVNVHFNMRMNVPLLKVSLLKGVYPQSYLVAEINKQIEYKEIGDYDIRLGPGMVRYIETSNSDYTSGNEYSGGRPKKRWKRFKQMILWILITVVSIATVDESSGNETVVAIAIVSTFISMPIAFGLFVGFLINR